MSEHIEERIAKILADCCPAFKRTGERAPDVWDNCYCTASAAKKTPCCCVWHKTDSCKAGVWPQLAFLRNEREDAEKEAAINLRNAKAAIGKTGGPQ